VLVVVVVVIVDDDGDVEDTDDEDNNNDGDALFKIPHKPPAGSLKVLNAPARRERIRRASKTKINNLGTDEYASNPPFSKISPNFRRERWIKKKRKPGIKKIIILKSGTLARKPFQII
jgi:hypothetical protein